MKRGLFLIALLLVLYSADAYAAGLTPGKITVDFTPNLKTDLQFTAKGYNGIAVETSCGYLKYNNDAKKNPDGTISFTTTLTLPDKMPNPGPTDCGVKIKESAPQTQGMIQTRIDLIGTVTINAPYSGEEARITLSAENKNKGEPIMLIVKAENLGEKPMTGAQANIDVTGQEQETTMLTGKEDIRPGATAKLTAQLDTAKLKPGKYKAKATLAYGEGRTATDEKEFIIGTLQVNIVSYPEELEIGSEKPFEVNIESLWGKPISNAYATVTITKQGISVAELRTASQTLSPWQQATITSDINTTQFKPEEYGVQINLHYEDKLSTKTGKIKFKPKEEPRRPMMEIIKENAKKPVTLIALTALIIISDIIWLITRKPKKLPHLTLKGR